MATQWDKPGQGDKGDTGKQGGQDEIGKQGGHGDVGKQGGQGGGMPREDEKQFPEKKKEGDLPR